MWWHLRNVNIYQLSYGQFVSAEKKANTKDFIWYGQKLDSTSYMIIMNLAGESLTLEQKSFSFVYLLESHSIFYFGTLPPVECQIYSWSTWFRFYFTLQLLCNNKCIHKGMSTLRIKPISTKFKPSNFLFKMLNTTKPAAVLFFFLPHSSWAFQVRNIYELIPKRFSWDIIKHLEKFCDERNKKKRPKKQASILRSQNIDDADAEKNNNNDVVDALAF